MMNFSAKKALLTVMAVFLLLSLVSGTVLAEGIDNPDKFVEYEEGKVYTLNTVHLYRKDRDFGVLSFYGAVGKINSNPSNMHYTIELCSELMLSRYDSPGVTYGIVSYSDAIYFPNAPITIKGNGHAMTVYGDIVARAPITFEDVTLTMGYDSDVSYYKECSLYMDGHALVIESNVKTPTPKNPEDTPYFTVENIYGGSRDGLVESASIIIKTGNYRRIIGGSPANKGFVSESIYMQLSGCTVKEPIYGSAEQVLGSGASILECTKDLESKIDKSSFSKIKFFEIPTSLPEPPKSATASFTGEELLASPNKPFTAANANKTVSLTPQVIAAINPARGSKLNIYFGNSDTERKPNESFEFSIELDGNNTPLSGMQIPVTIDVSGLNLNAGQITGFTGIIYNEDGTYRQLGGEFSLDMKSFMFYAPGTGTLGTLVSNKLTKMKLSIGSASYVLNNEQKTNDVAPVIIDGRTLLPLRVIAEALDASIQWDGATNTATLVNEDGAAVFLTIGQPLPNNLGTPVIIDSRTFVPVRYIAEALGAHVVWADAEKAVYIYR